MTLVELQAELDAIDTTLQRLRRSDYEIGGDAIFATNLRQYIVERLQGLRNGIDEIVLSIDHVDDLSKMTTMRQKLTATFQGLLGNGDPK